MRRVVIESPFSADDAHEVERNVSYACAAMRDCIRRGEAPFVSHLLYTQVLDDADPVQRRSGMDAGFEWHNVAHAVVVYTDRGISPGMQEGIARASRTGLPIEYRTIPNT